MIQKLLNVVFFCFMVLLVAFEAEKFFLTFYPPSIYSDVHLVNPVVSRGGILRISYTFTRNRICRVIIDRFIYSDEQIPNIIWRDEIPGGAGNTGGDVMVINNIKLPDDLGPGSYMFRTFTFSQCGETTHATSHEMLRFTVVP